jgi:hypothetical protein
MWDEMGVRIREREGGEGCGVRMMESRCEFDVNGIS